MEFKINIETNFKDDKRDLLIVDKELRPDKKGRMWKWYKYHCNICGFDNGWNEESHLMKGIGCSCCRGFTVVKGINDVATTHPEYIKYFVNIADAYRITYSSTKEVLLKCPECDCQKKMKMDQFHRYGLACNKCSDGISYPEKYMYSLLEQIGVKFITQLGKKNFVWCENFHYDFYLPDFNCIIETHGEQHFNCDAHYGFKSVEDEKKNDARKKTLALQNGIKNYFVIDCRKSNTDWMKSSIIESGLLSFLYSGENNIDWWKCQEYTMHSLIVSVCKYKNNHPTLSSTEIAPIFHLWRTTVQRYMKRGAEIGICIYDKAEDIRIGHLKSGLTKIKNNKRKKSA